MLPSCYAHNDIDTMSIERLETHAADHIYIWYQTFSGSVTNGVDNPIGDTSGEGLISFYCEAKLKSRVHHQSHTREFDAFLNQ